ncbi:MAG: glycoside hydrolase family 65 protein [Halorhodospira sp.]
MTLPETEGWQLTYYGWDPQQQQHREAICTLGNGRFATRGAFEGANAGDTHYPGTYMAGGYNRRTSLVAGREVENEDLVNLPNWLCLRFRPLAGDWLDLDAVTWLDYRQCLDVRHGVLTYLLHFRDAAGRETRLTSRRLVHMADSHLAALAWQLEPLNWSGGIVIRSGIDGGVENLGVPRYRQLETRHLDCLEAAPCGDDTVLLRSATNQSRLELAQTARTRAWRDDGAGEQDRKLIREAGYIGHELHIEAQAGQPITVEKVVASYSSRDHAICEPGLDARSAAAQAPGFEELLRTHAKAWERYWRGWDVTLRSEEDGGAGEGSLEQQTVLRLHIFHLLQTTSLHTTDLDVGVPARGLHGEAYRGHIFWDELFILPLLNLHSPEITRALLMYRYRRLPAARRAAAAAGLAGAMFPWQSGSNGREETQTLHLNPESGRWLPDHTHRQRHVNAAIVYNIWRYYEVTGDTGFLAFAGAEMILSIARFWASAASYNPQRGRYEIHGVVGPDEFHTHTPGSEAPGLANNAYTNVMAAWCLHIAERTLEALCRTPRNELLDRLEIDETEIQRWREISQRMFIPFHDGAIISQFEGYEQLAELDWPAYRERYGNIQRLDRILEAEGEDINRYRASKQADVLMLFYLFSREQIEALFARLGYELDPEAIPRNIAYYERRTSHGSTLSNIVHSWVLARSDRQRSWDLFGNALISDLGDIQGGTTREGIHLGAMAGTVDLLLRGYTGLDLRDGVLWLDPMLPEGLRELERKIHYRGHWIHLVANHEKLTLSLEEGPCPPVRIGYGDTIHDLEQGATLELPYQRAPGNAPFR